MAIGILFVMLTAACDSSSETGQDEPATGSSIVNLDHLDSLGEVVTHNGEEVRLIHIYAEAPDYNWVGDPDEGVSCVDDVARSAVVYLRHFELTGDEESADKAVQLLRFILNMQTAEGTYFNFVLSNELDINTTHQNSIANEMNWWGGRAVWALGTGARVLAQHDPAFAQVCLESVERALPPVNDFLETYPETQTVNGYSMPTWLISGTASDATSELLLGLVAADKATSHGNYQDAIGKISEGMAIMQYGDLAEAPYGAHISWEGGWHGWGNSQTMALAEAGKTESARYEADHFYPWLLVNGWLHSFELQDPSNRRYFEQIAYAVRPVSVGMLRLYETTGSEKYAVMAGLAASWLTGNNVTGQPMYDPEHGYGFDGINDENNINKNSGAESTIEALLTIMEVEQHPVANKWMYAKGGDAAEVEKDGKSYRYRVFSVDRNGVTDNIAVVLNLTDAVATLMNETELNRLTDS
ncbi:MAG: hypothetical protein LC662_03800 [Rhodothermaceae bacterium]|nr:hypothetical protein [Rhodothermaceae bacterium]